MDPGRAFEHLPKSLEGCEHLFVSNVEILKVVRQPADQKEEHFRADIYCGSELPDHMSTRRSAKIMFDLVQIGPGNRVTIFKSDACGELPLREAERFAPLSEKFAERPHLMTGPSVLMINWNSIFS
jgi:hypothetical protein